MAPKKKWAIAQYVREEVAKKPSITSLELWQSIPSVDDPNNRQDPTKIGGYELSRELVEGKERLVQRHTRTNASPDISYNTFRQYVAEEKTNLLNNNKSSR
jgi:hypothetical protein